MLLGTDKIQEEIIDKLIESTCTMMIHEKSKDGGDDKICEELYKCFRACYIYLITSMLCVTYIFFCIGSNIVEGCFTLNLQEDY